MLSGPRRTALAAGITVAVASLATTRGFGPFDSPYQLQTFLALCVLPVLLLQAVMAERDTGHRHGARQRRAISRLHRQQLGGHLPHRARRAHAGHAARPTIRLRGCANTASSPSATPRSWWRSASRMPSSPVVGTRLGDHPDLVARSTSSASARRFATATRCATSSTSCMGRTDSIACC